MQKTILIALFLLAALPVRLFAQDPAYPPAPASPLNVTVGEFFVDIDPGFGNATTVSFTPVVDISAIPVTIPTAALSAGVHRLFLRTLNAEGEWSVTTVREFIMNFDPAYPVVPPPGNIVKAEQFVDIDPGFGNASNITITPGVDIADIPATISTGSLLLGVHRLFTRTLNAEGQWSISSIRPFVIDFDPAYPVNPAPQNITKAEYFVNTDPGFGNGNNIPVTAGLDLPNQNAPINITGLPQGGHQVYIRTLNNEGEWSVTSVSDFVINEDPFYPTAPVAPGNITRVEYFINTDPGFGNGTTITITPAVNIADLTFAANINGLPGGIHRLYIRSLDDWSITSVREFEVIAPTPNVTISGAITGDFQTLKEAFDAINAGGGSGNVTVSVVGNTTETAQSVLNQTNYIVQVEPQGNRLVEGNLTTAIVLLDGADNVTINGQSLSGANTLTFRNINTAATANVIRLLDAASNNVIKKCIIEGSSNGTTASSGAIVINSTSLGNALNNIIDSNIIRSSTVSGLNRGIVIARQFTTSASTINNTQVTNNHVENVFSSNATSNYGIIIGNNSINTLIKGNSIYNTIAYANSANAVQYIAINVSSTGTTSGTGTTIDSNFVGGTAAGATGGKMLISSPNNSISTRAIVLSENSTATVSSVTNNVIRNIDIDMANPVTTAINPFMGIWVVSANLNRFDNNTIGAVTNNSISMLVKPASTGTVTCFGFLIQTNCANPVANNFAGGLDITVTPLSGSTVVPALAILDTRGGSNTILKKNIIGSAVANNISITNNSSSLFTLNVLDNSSPVAVSNVQIDSNTVRNITVNNVNLSCIGHTNSTASATSATVTMNGNEVAGITVSGSSGLTNGISYSTSSTVTNLAHTLNLNGNLVNNITASSGTGISLRGIRINNGSTSVNRIKGRVSGNQVNGITNNATGTGGLSSGLIFRNDIVVGDSMVIASNTISSVADAGTTISADQNANSNGLVLSMENSASNGIAVVRDNIVHGIITTTTDNAALRVNGIAVFGNTTVVERNKIYDLQNAAASATARIEPLLLMSRADDASISLVRNNMFAVNTITHAQIAGIRLAGLAVKSNIYHNSIVTEGTSDNNSYVLLKDATVVADVKNNILYNAVTGAGNAFAIGLQTDATGYTGNNNYFVSPATATLTQVGAAAHTLTSWQAATLQDVATQEGQAAVNTNPGDLFLNKAVAELLINTAHATEPVKASDKGLALSKFVP